MPELIKKQNFVFEKISQNNPTLKVMDFLINNKSRDFSLSEIAGYSEIARATLYKGLLKFLLNEGIITRTRVVGNVKLYKINLEDEKVKALTKLHESLKGIEND